MRWDEQVALPTGFSSRVIELDVDVSVSLGYDMKALGGRVSYSKRDFSKGGAWDHLTENPPEFRADGKAYTPNQPTVTYGPEKKTGRQNPYRAQHTRECWVWDIVFGWAINRTPAKRKAFSSRYDRLKSSKDAFRDEPV